MVPNVTFLILNGFFGHRFKTQPRLLVSLVMVIVMFTFTSVMVKVFIYLFFHAHKISGPWYLFSPSHQKKSVCQSLFISCRYAG